MCGGGCVGGALGVDHELDDAGLVAEVDEDQAAVVAPARDPAGDGDLIPDPLGAKLAPLLCPANSSLELRDERLDVRCLPWLDDLHSARAETARLRALALHRPAGVVHVGADVPAPELGQRRGDRRPVGALVGDEDVDALGLQVGVGEREQQALDPAPNPIPGVGGPPIASISPS